MKKVIKTEFEPVPVLNKKFDWVAYIDGEEEAGQYGYGPTEDEAIQNLKDLLDENL